MGYGIGIDLGGGHLAAGVVDASGQIISRADRALPRGAAVDQVLADLAGAARTALGQAGIQPSEVDGVGVGLPGTIDPRTGSVLMAPNLGWKDVPARALLERALPWPVYVENDANAAVIGEGWCGAGAGVNDLVCLTLGTGIGGGIILAGGIYRGANGTAGEIGHMVVADDGPICGCGRRGCLETLASGRAIGVRALELLRQEGRGDLLAELGLPEAAEAGFGAREVFWLAARGHGFAQAVLAEAIGYLGLAIANLAAVLNPELVIIGGGVSRAGEPLLGPLRAQVARRALGGPGGAPAIVAARLGNDAGIVGAAALALKPEHRDRR